MAKIVKQVGKKVEKGEMVGTFDFNL